MHSPTARRDVHVSITPDIGPISSVVLCGAMRRGLTPCRWLLVASICRARTRCRVRVARGRARVPLNWFVRGSRPRTVSARRVRVRAARGCLVVVRGEAEPRRKKSDAILSMRLIATMCIVVALSQDIMLRFDVTAFVHVGVCML